MTEVIMDEIEEQPSFQKFELVWAKILGWPWWPARVTQIPSQKNPNYRVEFIADTSCAYLPSEKLMSFIQGRDRHSTPKGHYRNFAKALGIAMKAYQSQSVTKDEAVSECTSRDKHHHQQIQIINYSQQVKSAFKPSPQQQIEAQMEYNPIRRVHRPPSRPSKLMKRRETLGHASRNLENIGKVNQLLHKYKLQHIGDKWSKKAVKKSNKTKLIQKDWEHSRVRTLAARLICKGLSVKQISLEERHQISQCLMDSLLANREKGVQGVHRALFQWIRCNDTETIMKNYTNWPTDTKCDHLTDCS